MARSLASLVARWNSSGNRNTLSLMLMTADDLREALRSGRIDVAIVDSVFGLDAFVHMELVATDMVAIAPLRQHGADGDGTGRKSSALRAEPAYRHRQCRHGFRL